MFSRALPSVLAGRGKRRARIAPRLPWLFMLPLDIGLFLSSARTDAVIARNRGGDGAKAAFEAAYTRSADPWSSASKRYRYQSLKYDKLVALLPAGPLGNVLDLGCGLGLLSQKLAARSEHVLGIDIAAAPIGHARLRGAGFGNLDFAAGDLLDLPASLDGSFDLVVLADVLYYLSPLDDAMLASVILRVAQLLSPNGTCLLANHFFFSADPESRLSRRIHRAFGQSPCFAILADHRRAFFLATLFSRQPEPLPA
jgi:SAM-dependent methyltransferase